MKSINLISFLFICSVANAQLTFQKSIINISASQTGLGLCGTRDSGFVICGAGTVPFSIGHICMVKLTSTGDSGWVRSISSPNDGAANDVIEASDGGIVSTGYYAGGANGTDAFLFKTDSAGNFAWFKQYGGSQAETGYSLIELNDKGFLLTGFTESSINTNRHIYLVRTDSVGTMIWNKVIILNTFGEPAYSISKTSDGGFIITGSNCFLLKTDSAGNTLWSKNYSTMLSYYADGYSVKQTSDGGYVIAGTVQVSVSGDDGLIIRTDSAGNVLWKKRYHHLQYTQFNKLIIDANGNFIVAGSTSGNPMYDFIAMETDSMGNILWSRSYGSTSHDMASGIIQTNDGFIISGTGESDSYILVVKTDSTGNSPCNDSISQMVVDTAALQTIILTATDTIVGTTTSYTPSLSIGGQVIPLCISLGIEEQPELSFSLYPVPASDYFNIDVSNLSGQTRISMINSLGELIMQNDYTATGVISISTDKFFNGIYSVLINNQGRQLVKRMIITH